MATAMELHKRQLNISTISNNVSCKNSRLLNNFENLASGAVTTTNTSKVLTKHNTIENGLILSLVGRSQKSMKQAIKESFAMQQLAKAQR